MASAVPYPTDLPGAGDLFAWFGHWPSFHDAEIESVELRSTGESGIRMRTWEITSEVDTEGHYILRKHVAVDFIFAEIVSIELTELRLHGIVLSLSITKTDEIIRMEWSSSYGIEGQISARALRIELNRADR